MMSDPQIQAKRMKTNGLAHAHRLVWYVVVLIVPFLFPLTTVGQTPAKVQKPEKSPDKSRAITPRRGSPQRSDKAKEAAAIGKVKIPPAAAGVTIEPVAQPVEDKSKTIMTAKERAMQRREEIKARQRKHKESQAAAAASKPASARAGRVNVAKSVGRGGSTAKETAIDIPPTFSSVMPEEGKYQFSIVDGTYEDLISMVARETGLGVIGVKPPDGRVSFVTEEELSFAELLKRIRMLLFNYKPLEPYWMLRRDTHLEVIRVNDYLRELEPEMMYRSEADFQAAQLADEELVLVLYTPQSGSLSDLTIVRDFMPDYVRVTPLENSNTVAIFALASDIRKYLDLVPILVSPQGQDPRTLEVIDVIHIPPSEAYEKLKELMDLDVATARPRSRAPRGVNKSALDSVEEPALSVVPSDGQGVLIVRGMRNKIEEIKLLLPYVDVDTSIEFRPVVIDVKYANPESLVVTLQDILTPPEDASKVKRPTSRGRKPAGQSATVDEIRLITHPVARAIIVMASDQDVARVRQLVESFDIETEVGPIRIALKHTEAEDIVGTISKLIDGSIVKQPKNARSPSEKQSEVVAAPNGDAIYFTGSPEDLEQVKLLLVELDVAGEAVELHIVQLKNQLPSFVASILQEYETSRAGTGSVPKRPVRARRPAGKSESKGKFTSDDDGGRLYVLCNDEEWSDIKTVIDELEQLSQSAEFVVIPVEHISAEVAIEKISALIEGGGATRGPAAKKGGIRYETTDGGMVVIGAKDSEVTLIKQLLAQFDQPDDIVQRVFVIKHRKAEDMMATISSLLADSAKKPTRGKPRPGMPTTGGDDDGPLKIIQLDDRLIVRTSPAQMEEVAALILEFDVARDQREIRVYDDFPPGTDVVALSDSLQSLMSSKESGSAVTPPTARKAAASPEGAQFLPQASSGKLIVVAEPAMFAEIEKLLDILRPKEEIDEVLVEYVAITHADPEQIVELIEPLLSIKVQHLILTGVIEDVAGRDKPSVRIAGQRKPTSSAGDGDLYQLLPDARNHRIVVAAAEPIVIEARKLIQAFDTPSEGDEIQTAFIKIEHADSIELIELIEPLLSLKVQQLVSEGELADEAESSTSSAARKPGVRIAGRTAKADSERFHMVVDERNHRIVIAAPVSIIEEARLLIKQFDLPAESGDAVEVITIAVRFVPPSDIVEQIAPLLELKVQQLVMAGSLSEQEGSVSAPKSNRGGKVTIPRKKTTSQPDRYHLQADDRNAQIVLAAPRAIIDEARELVEMFDKASDESSAFETISLQNADASEMVSSIQSLMGGDTRKRSPGTKLKAQMNIANPAGEFQIVEAPGGAAVVLQGPIKLVAKAKEWIAHLDSIAGGARSLKIYQIKHIDMKMLVDLIVNTVSVPAKRAGVRRQGGQARAKAGGSRQMLASMDDEDEDEAFVTTITRTTDDIYLRADLIDHTLIVSASPAKLTEVDRIISNLDTPDELYNPPSVPKFIYTLEHVDAYDASYELDGVLSALWEPSDELPHVDYASFGDMLIVRYPHRDRFDEIRNLIREYVDIESELARSRPKAFAVPVGISPKDVALWMKINHPELDIEIEDMSPREDQSQGMQQLGPRTSAVNRCVMPLAFTSALQGLAASAMGQTEEQPKRDAPPPGDVKESTAKSAPPQQPVSSGDRDALSDLVHDKGRALLEDEPGEGRDDEVVTTERMPKNTKKPTSAEKVIIKYDESTGGMIVVGPRQVLEEVPDWLDELKEEMKDLPRPPDIRIYRVKYIDVYSATEIINEMFNATQQQRQEVSRAQQQQQQRARQQQQQQQQQQQKGQQDDKRQADQQKNQPQAVPQLPPTSVRVMPNPRDRSLILRADTNQYPAILKLLATVDQPRPINSEMRIYPVKKLNAAEVEMLLKDWLGMSDSTTRAATPSPKSSVAGRRGSATTASLSSGNGGQFPRPIMQRTAAGDMLGIDPEDIKLTSSPRNNSIMALGPVAALDFIGTLIEDLESNEIAERTWVQYELVHASVPALLAYLRGRYAEGEEDKSAGRQMDDSEISMSAAGSLNSPTLIGYPPLKILSVQGTAEQHAEIAELVAKFDRPAQADFEVINLAHADASMVAETLTSIFQGVNLTQGSQKRVAKESKTSSTAQTRFIGQEGGRTVFYSAPEHLHEKILETVKKLEEEAQERASLRMITLEHARPSEVSQAITMAYAPSARDSGSTLPPFTVTGDDNSKQLLVMTDDEMFLEIQSLAKLLDKPREFEAEFRVFRLKHANARRIYETLSKLMGDYVKGLPASDQIDGFGADVDDQANAIVVLGGPLIFGFVEHALQRIDTPENADQPPGFFMIALKNSDAREVASNITRLWSGAVGTAGEDPPIVEANATLNVLVVRGTQKQVDQIKKDFVDPLEDNIAPQLMTETIALQHIRVEEAAELITTIYDKRQEAMQEISGGKIVSPHEYTVVVTPDGSTNTLVVQASQANVTDIKARIADMDQPDVAAQYAVTTKVYGLTFANPASVVTIIKERSRMKEQGGGKKKTSLQDLVLAVEEPATQSVAVTANAHNHEWVQTLIRQLDDKETALSRIDQVKTFKLAFADPFIVSEAISQLFRGGGKSSQTPVIAVAEPVARVVIVTASQANLSRIELLIAELDTEGSSRQSVHVVHLSNADAESVVKTIDDIFIKSQPNRQGSQAPPISISALGGSKAVLVKSSAEDFADIQAIVKQLDTEEAGTGEVVRVLTLLYADATEVQLAMEAYLKKSGDKGSDELVGDTRISVLTQSNGLVVSGSAGRVEQIEQLVKQLDEESEKGVVPQIIKLKYADVGFILPQLQEMFVDQKGGGKRDRVQPVIVSNDLMNSLIIRAAPADIAAIEAIVSKLDTEEAASVTPFKIIKVASGINVEELADLLETSVNEGIKAAAPKGKGRSEVATVSIQADKRTSTLVVAGNQSYFNDIEEMVSAYERLGPTGETIKIIQLGSTPANEVMALIDQLKGGTTGSKGSRGTTNKRSSGTRSSGSTSSKTQTTRGR